MSAKTFTLSFALAAFLAQLVLAAVDFDVKSIHCNEYGEYLKNGKTFSRFVRDTIDNIKKNGDCNVSVYLALALEPKCQLSRYDESLGPAIASYVGKCVPGNYWESFLEEPRSQINDEFNELALVFTDNYMKKFRDRLRKPEDSLQLFPTREEEQLIYRNLMKISKKSSPYKYPNTYKVINPCRNIVHNYRNPMEWIERTLDATGGSDWYLNKLPPQTLKEFLQFEICQYIVNNEGSFNKEMDFRNMFPHDHLYNLDESN